MRFNVRPEALLAKIHVLHRHNTRLIPWWSGFCLALILPLSTLCFLLTGPHEIVGSLLWTLPVGLLIYADTRGPRETRSIPANAPRGFFDGIIYAVAMLQLLNLIAMGVMVSSLEWHGPGAVGVSLVNLLVLRILGGTNACCSVIAPAHELIHRRGQWQRILGRVMLISVFYDPFFVAHRLGHHAQLGRAGDPSTAAIHESYEDFFWRSMSSQCLIAWRARPGMLLQGLLVQLLLMVCFGWAFGGLALFMWFYQSWVAIRLLEAVNYFQHFGMIHPSEHAATRAWHCDSAVSLFMFFGLPRHADHHARPGKSYWDLEDVAGGPKLPYGYLGTAIWVKNASRSYREWIVSKRYSDQQTVPPCTADGC